MSCSPFDLRDYFLEELPESEGRQVEAHVKICQGCREELDRLRLTETALLSLGEDEIPQRIAFVSDKIFEPSPARRWWEAFWGSTARVAFASAALLAGAIVFHAVRVPAPVPVIARAPEPKPATTVVQTVSDADIQARVDAAVNKAVAAEREKTKALLTEVEDARKALRFAATEYDYSRRRADTLRASNYTMPPARMGEVR